VPSALASLWSASLPGHPGHAGLQVRRALVTDRSRLYSLRRSVPGTEVPGIDPYCHTLPTTIPIQSSGTTSQAQLSYGTDLYEFELVAVQRAGKHSTVLIPLQYISLQVKSTSSDAGTTCAVS
jgi:hypothetical protein